MRVSTSDGYHGKRDCPVFSECESFYCPIHRLLWSFCETAKAGVEGDSDVINGTRVLYEMGDCPKCESEARGKKYAQVS